MTRDAMTWDRAAIRAGAGVCLLFAVPFQIGARIAADADNSALAVVLTLGLVAGFVVGGGCAAWVQRAGTPMSHGIVTAAGTYVAAQAVFIAVRLVRGESVRWFAAWFNLTVVVVAGLIGGLLAQRLIQRGIAPTSTSGRSGR